MAIAQKLAGYTLGGADMLRRAMGKKKKKELDAQFEVFSSGMAERGYSAVAMQTVWDVLLPFSDYAFNKSHSAAYGLVSYWTAYLKANYPAEYMAALLQSVKDDKDKLAIYLAECRHMGIQVLAPDVNDSQAMFTAVGEAIRFGLGGIRNVGHHVVSGIIAARDEHGRATSFSQFLDHVPLVVCNKRMIESLIKAGGFDSMGHTRRALMEIYEHAIDEVITLKRNQENGQDDLFADLAFADEKLMSHNAEVMDLPEWEKTTKLAFEREMLGLYVSDHPLQGLEHVLQRHRDYSLGVVASPEGPAEGTTVTICGMVTQLTRKQTKTGQVWAILNVEDLDGSVEVMVFSRVYEAVAMQLATDVVVKVRGRIKRGDDNVAIQAADLTLPEIAAEGGAGPVNIQLPISRCTPPVVEQLKVVLRQHPGVQEVRVTLLSNDRATTFRLHEGLRVNPSQPLMADLKALLGPSCLV